LECELLQVSEKTEQTEKEKEIVKEIITPSNVTFFF
jgi:hypothetical protein